MNFKQEEQNEDLHFDETELRGFSRSVAELEWLLLALVLFYYVAPELYKENSGAIVAGMGAFAAFVLSFRYLNFYRRESRWKIAIETWAMIAFITWTLLFTGTVESPLLNLYILVIITAGLTLGKLMTLLEIALITACYMWLGHELYSDGVFTIGYFSNLMAKLSPFLLVAYLTTMLSADLHYAKRSFQKLSDTDELTGIGNRRAIARTLAQELEKAVRYSRPFSVLLIDADDLKLTNDKFGHEAGDRLVKLVADTISSSLRAADTVARVGGDEFEVLMPETDRQHAVDAAHRIRLAIANASIPISDQSVRTTVTIGVASYPENGRSPEELKQKADTAMYAGKKQGRNRVLTYSQLE